MQQYGRDDQRLAGARHFARTGGEKDGTIRQEAWVPETGELLKVAREQRRASTMEREEYSFDAQGDVYFAFHRMDEKQADGGMKVTEHRTYVENGNAIAMRRRIVNLPAGAPLELTSQELNVEALPSAEQKLNMGTQEQAKGIAERGRYAVAIAPTGKKIDWAEYQDKELGNDVYTLDTDGEGGVDNVIVDFQTHRVFAGSTDLFYKLFPRRQRSRSPRASRCRPCLDRLLRQMRR
ncbi:MAG: hypothetical protein JWL59_3435 [Chthoniobacteraceae bacterium]|nr:hypothetical protein [Chthoniobacteraceae bacterium]